MKAIHYDCIGSFYYAKERGVKEKHPQEVMRELGLKLIISIPESIADCWNCLVEDFDFESELPDFIKVNENIPWNYFYHYAPDICMDIMKKHGVDYQEVIRKIEDDKKKEQEKKEIVKKLNKFDILDISEVSAYDIAGNCIFTLTIPE